MASLRNGKPEQTPMSHRQYSKLAEHAIEMRPACFAASSFAAVPLVLLECFLQLTSRKSG